MQAGLLGRGARALYDQPALLLVLTTLFWAGNAIAGQLARGEIAPFQLVLARWVLVSATLIPLFGRELRAHWTLVRGHLLLIAALATLGFTLFNALFYAASLHTTGVNIGILQGAMPVLVLIGAFLAYGTPIRPLQAIGVTATLVGVVLVATRGAPFSVFAIGVNPGDALMLIACALYAFYAVGLQRRPAIPGRAFFTLMAGIAALASIPFAVGEAMISRPGWPSLDGWVITLYVAVFPSCLAQLFFLRGVDLIGPGRAGVYINLVPVFTPILAIILLNQSFYLYHGVALGLVVGGIWLAQRTRR